MPNNILVVGYTYINDSQRATFDFYPRPENVFFLLPKIWKARFGKVIYHGPKAKNIFLTRAYFHHSLYPVIGGLLKGWMPNFPFVLLKLKSAKKNIKLVYSCSEPTLLTTLYLAFWSKLFGIKFVSFSWENLPYEKKSFPWFKKFIFRLTMFFSDGLICGTQKSKEINQPYAGHKPTAVFPMNGLNQDFFKKQNGPKTFRNVDFSDKVVFSFVGAIDKRKGVHLIVEAFPEVLKKVPSGHLIITGSGNNDAEVEKLIQKLNLSEKVTRVPWIDHNEIVKLFSISDVFIYPSIPHEGWEEQFGYAMAEASLMGLPVISTRSGSIEDVVKDEKTGILVPPNSASALAEAMIRLGQNKEFRESLGLAGREYTSENLSREAIAKKFHDFFESLTYGEFVEL